MSDRHSTNLDRRAFVQLLGLGGSLPLAAWLLAVSSEETGAAPARTGAVSGRAAVGPWAVRFAQEGGGGELVIGLDQEPPTLDPHASPSAATFQIMSSVAESLLYLDAERQLRPWLAEAWEASPDARQYTFRLRQGITFHDGEPVNAEAVKFNFDRIVDPNF